MSTAGKRPVVSLLDEDDDLDQELAASKRRTEERRAARRQKVNSSGSATAPAIATSSAASSSSAQAQAAVASGAPSTFAASSSSAGSSSWRRPSAPITCPVCFCDTEPDEACLLAACNHGFCTECLSTYVRGKVAAGEILADQLTCPMVEPSRCGASLVPQDVRRCLESEAEGDRYERLCLQRCVEAEDDLATCPTAGCPFMFAWEEGNRKLECPLCLKSYCLVCRAGPWHRGMRCEQYQAERGDPEASDAAFAAFAKQQKLKQCPKCKFWVEKKDGCDAMHCRCNFVFCYKCGGVLKATATRMGPGSAISVCECGSNRAEELRIHEQARTNHNNLLRARR